LQDAAKAAANRLGAAADAVTGNAQFPEYPPQEQYDALGSGSSKGEQSGQTGQTNSDSFDRTASSAGGYSDGKSVGDWVRESAEMLGDSIADSTGAAAARLGMSSKQQEGSPAGGLGDAIRSTVRTAADFGSPETSERLTEMSAQSENPEQQSNMQSNMQDSSSRAIGSGGSQEGFTWGDVSGLSDALGMGEPVEGGYYAYRSTDNLPGDFGSSSSGGDPLSTRSFRRRSARGSRGATDPSPYTPHSSIDGLTTATAGSGSSAAADVPHAAAAAAASGGNLSAIAGEKSGTRTSGGGGTGSRQRGRSSSDESSAMPASATTASAAASTVGASDAGRVEDQKWDWGGLPSPEAAVKADVGTPSLMQQDGMDLAGALGSVPPTSGEGLVRKAWSVWGHLMLKD
jgi:hypothetical protein